MWPPNYIYAALKGTTDKIILHMYIILFGKNHFLNVCVCVCVCARARACVRACVCVHLVLMQFRI